MNERDLAKLLKKCKSAKIVCKALAVATVGLSLIFAQAIGALNVYEVATKKVIEEQNT